MSSPRVLLVGDDPLALAGLAALLDLPGASAVEVAGSGPLDDAPALLEGLRPEVLCWDAVGAEAAGAGLVQAAGAAPVLALLGPSGRSGELYRAGVRGLVDRRAGGPALAAALVAVARGLAVLEPSLAGAWLRPTGLAGDEAGPDALTPREREVLALLAEGLGNKAIAARLDLSEHTAKFHVTAILAKLGAGTRAEAIVRAVRRGLVAL